MRRMALLVGMMTLFVVVAAGMAWAVTMTCEEDECFGTSDDDVLYEQVGTGEPDHIYGLAGHDVIDANTFNQDRDQLEGGRGRDKLLSNDGDARDRLMGGSGRDICYVDRGDTRRGCEIIRIRTGAKTSSVAQDLSAAQFTSP